MAWQTCHSTALPWELQEALEKRGGTLKCVVMSATLEAQKFHEYFDNAPLMEVPGEWPRRNPGAGRPQYACAQRTCTACTFTTRALWWVAPRIKRLWQHLLPGRLHAVEMFYSLRPQQDYLEAVRRM